MIELPPSLEMSVNALEKRLLKKPIESLVVPMEDIDESHKATRRRLSSKVVPSVGASRKRPLVTMHVSDCNALVLTNDEVFFLLHEYSCMEPESYLKEILDLTVERVGKGIEKFRSIQIGGDREAFDGIGNFLQEYGIQPATSYCDNWKWGEWVDLVESNGKSEKDIFVFPEYGRVTLRKFRYVPVSETECLREESFEILYSTKKSC